MAHIQFAHPEVTLEQIAATLADPDEVRMSTTGKNVKLYYQVKTKRRGTVRYVSVVVKQTTKHEELIVTAMTNGGIKVGEVIYTKGKNK